MVFVGSPLVFGANRLWPLAAIQVLLAIAFLAWVLAMLVEGSLVWRRTSLDLPFGLLTGAVILQLVLGDGPLARWALAPPPPVGETISAIPTPFFTLGTVSPLHTHESLLVLLTYAAAYVLVVNLFSRRRHLERLIQTLLVLGAFLALIGLFGRFEQIMIGHGVVGGRAMATFGNADHFGAWLNMLICLGLGYVISRHRSRWRGSSALELLGRRQSREDMIARYYPFGALAVMALAVVFTLSRGAVISLLCALATVLALSGRLGLARRHFVVSGVLLAVTLGYGAWIGLEPLISRFGSGELAVDARWALYKSIVPMLRDFPILGTGLGAYKTMYWRYQPIELRPSKFLFNYAHNDILQFAVELGTVGVVIAVFALWRVAGDLVGAHLLGRTRCPVGAGEGQWAERKDPFSVSLAFGGLAGALSLGLHSTVDFSARIPANGILAAVCLGITTVCLHTRFGAESSTLSEVRQVMLGRHVYRAGVAALITLVLSVVVVDALDPVFADPLIGWEEFQITPPSDTRMLPPAILVRIARALRRTESSRSISSQGVDLDGRRFASVEARQQEATRLMSLAITDLRASIALAPSNPYLHERLAHALEFLSGIQPEPNARETRADALAHAQRAVALAPGNPDLYRSLAIMVPYLPERPVAIGFAAARSTIERDPTLLPNLVYHYMLLPLSERDWLSIVPDTAIDRVSLASNLEARRMIREARAVYQAAIEVASPAEQAFVRWITAEFLERQGQPQEAASQLAEALKREPQNPELLRARGDALAKLGDPGALDSYRAAVLKAEQIIRHRPKDHPLFQLTDPRVRALITEHVGTTEVSPRRFRTALAEYLADRKLWDQALAEWDNALAETPNDPEAHFSRGVVLDALGHKEDALEECRNADKLGLATAKFRLWFGRRLWENEQFYQAIAQWQDVVRHEPDNIESHLELGRAFIRIGDLPSAFREYRRILDLAPNNAEARRMVRADIRAR